jgi:putative SOS response-associated peptidase YedK
MCGRYDNVIAREAYRLIFGARRLPESNFPPRYNIAPTDPVPIVRIDPRDGAREVAMARWGLVPWWSKMMPRTPHINARAENVHRTPLFRAAVPVQDERSSTLCLRRSLAILPAGREGDPFRSDHRRRAEPACGFDP